MEKDPVRSLLTFGTLGYARGLVTGAGGNISCRRAEGMYITRSGVSLRAMEAADILAVDFQGRLLAPSPFRPSIETGFHSVIYRLRPEAGAVFHSHATYCTCWALEGKALPLVTSVSRMLLGSVPLAAAAEPGSPALAENVRRALEAAPEAKGLLLAGHGAVAWGADMEEAFYNAELMEQTAQIAWLTR